MPGGGVRRSAVFDANAALSRYVETKILSDEDVKNVHAIGAEFAKASDCADAVMRFLCDDSITGRFLPHLILAYPNS